MRELVLNGSQIKSHIYIGRGLIGDMPLEDIFAINKPSKVCIVTDKNIEKLFLEHLISSFEKYGIPVIKHVIEPGEEYKNLKTVSELYNTLSKEGLGRNDMVVALGGGVVGDITGFAAATYLRGIRNLVQIPTTLLAQVDSSVGGKCGVDLLQGKNLVGAFRQPDHVIIDPNALDTLSDSIFASGMAEVIKYGCIWEPMILDLVRNKGIRNHNKNMDDIITKCVQIKIRVVEEDETENELRKILNFGHTIGHSIEKLGNYSKYSHGEAISIGMAASVKTGEYAGITKKGCYEKLVKILEIFNLPTEIKYSIEDVYHSLLTDKKKQGDKISFIYIEDFGKVKIIENSLMELRSLMEVLSEDKNGKCMGK